MHTKEELHKELDRLLKEEKEIFEEWCRVNREYDSKIQLVKTVQEQVATELNKHYKN